MMLKDTHRLPVPRRVNFIGAALLLFCCLWVDAGTKIFGICNQTHTVVPALNRTVQFELWVKSEREFKLSVTTDDGLMIYGEYEDNRYWFRRHILDEINLLKVFPSTTITNLLSDDFLAEAIALSVLPGVSSDPVAALDASDLYARPFLTSTSTRLISPAGSAAREFEITGFIENGQSNVLGHFKTSLLPLEARGVATLTRYDPNRTSAPSNRTLTTYQIVVEKVENGVSLALFEERLIGVTRVIDRRKRSAIDAHVPTYYNLTNSPWPLKGTVVFQKRDLQPIQPQKTKRIILFVILFASASTFFLLYIYHKNSKNK
jgi:hypothetical protein